MFISPKDTSFMDAPWDPWFEQPRIKENSAAKVRRITRTLEIKGEEEMNCFYMVDELATLWPLK
jgi:hypothetical protein